MAIGGEVKHWADELCKDCCPDELFAMKARIQRVENLRNRLIDEEMRLIRREALLQVILEARYTAGVVLKAKVEFSTKLSKI